MQQYHTWTARVVIFEALGAFVHGSEFAPVVTYLRKKVFGIVDLAFDSKSCLK